MIHVCVPVLRRYDLLRRLLESLEGSTVPYEVHVIDNGRDNERAVEAMTLEDRGCPVGNRASSFDLISPKTPMGVAESWNWFIRNVPEERVIANDDVIFAPDSLERMAAAPGALAWSLEAGFSCFLIRDECARVVGLFDEAISPGYGYYEDEDYAQRLHGKGTRPPLVACGHVACGVSHPVQSQTLNAATRAELAEHHRRFIVARLNYAKKWGIDEATLR